MTRSDELKYGTLDGLSIRRIVDGYKSGRFSPEEIIKLYMARVAEHEPHLHAWACFDPDKALAQARTSAERMRAGAALGALEGVPIGVKDIFNTTDFPTEMGSRIWKGYTPGNDARVVFYLRQAGAVIPGKTATAEFAVHALGETVNPHDESRTPGTSSSGSAVAVAAGMVPAALGTQTAGSIVRPASFCGVYGFKPSFGLIPRTGMLKTTDSLDTVGYFSRHLEDLDLILDVLRVRGRNYPISDAALNDEARQSAPRGRPWRVAIVRTYVWDRAPQYAKEALLKWGRQLAALPSVEVTETQLPEPVFRAHDVHAAIYDKTLAYYFSEEFKQPELMSKVMREIVARGSAITKDHYLRALADQSAMAASMDRLFREYDLLLSLSTAGQAPLRDEAEAPDPALIWTTCQLPVASVPKFTSPEGLPFGAQIVARRYNDLQLVRFLSLLCSAELVPATAYPAPGTTKTASRGQFRWPVTSTRSSRT